MKGNFRIVNKRIYVSLIALAIMLGAVVPASSRTSGSASASASASPDTLTSSLPASDAIATIDIKRLLTDAMPRALDGNPQRLAEANAEIDRFKTRTGIDLRSFDRIAAGMRFDDKSSAATEASKVAVARGSFDSGAFVAAGRLAAKGKYREEKYQGKTVYIFTLDQQVKIFGVMNIKLVELAVSSLDANTLAMGDLSGVRAAIDASGGRGRVDPELVALATRNPQALIGFSANLPPSASENINIENDEITKNINSIKQIYGSVGMTPTGFDMLAVARTGNADQAQSLRDTIAAAKQLAGMLASRVSRSSDKGKLVENALDNMKVTIQGNEVQINLELAQTDIATLVRGF
jgi:hypothetical protein